MIRMRRQGVRLLTSLHDRFKSPSSHSFLSTLANPIPAGVYPILVTPFRDDKNESLDLDSWQHCLNFFVSSSNVCQGVVVAGVLGEANRLTDAERHELIHVAQEVILQSTNKEFHLCVGASHAGTAAAVQLCQMAQNLGAHSVLLAPNSSIHTVDLYQRVYDACGPNLGIVLQDFPAVSGVHLSVATLANIVKQVPSVRAIKLESLPTVERLAVIRQNKAFRECRILTGLGALYAGFDLEQGVSTSFMTGLAFPEILYALHSYAQQGDLERVHRLYRKFLPLLVLEQHSLALRKEIYKQRGLIASSRVRQPGSNISPTLLQTLEYELERSLPGVDLTQPLPPHILQV